MWWVVVAVLLICFGAAQTDVNPKKGDKPNPKMAPLFIAEEMRAVARKMDEAELYANMKQHGSNPVAHMILSVELERRGLSGATEQGAAYWKSVAQDQTKTRQEREAACTKVRSLGGWSA